MNRPALPAAAERAADAPSIALARQQDALLAALWAERPAQALRGARPWIFADGLAERGLRAYRSQGLALAGRALQAAYPVVAQMLGPENFAAVAQRLWRHHPPARGDLAQWGAGLAQWFAAQDVLVREEPCLPDIARAEWALHAVASAADAQTDAASFALLQAHDPGEVTLRLAPGTCCIASPWPVVSLIEAHTAGAASLAEAARRLRERVPETALVWRAGLQPRLRCATTGEARFLSALQQGCTLAQALAAAPDLIFDAWLLPAFQRGLVVGAARRP